MPLPASGDKIRYIGAPPGEFKFGEGHEPDVRWLEGGVVGTVVSFIDGYPRHRCPDHDEYPDCICGDDGIVEAMERCAVVDYPAVDHGHKPRAGVVSRCIDLSNEGETWERA